MKKLLALVLVMILSLTALVSCEMPESVDGILNTVKDKVNTLLGKEPTPEEPDEPEVVYDVAAAKEYLYTLYINSSVQTPNDYTLVKQVYINRVPHPVVWTTNTELVKIVENETDVTVDVDEKSAEDLPYTLTATITAGGQTESVSFERMVPAYNLLTYAEYLEKQTNDSVTIEGIVTLVRSQSKGNTRDQLFIQDLSGEGGYYVYYTKEDYVDKLGLKVGMTVSVTGIKEIYNGNTHEIKDAVVTIKNDGAITELAPTDITALFADAKDSKDAALMGKLGMLVTIKGAVIGDQDLGEKAKYLYFEIDGVTTYVRVYTTDLGVGIMTSEQEAQIFTDHANHRDYTANITGVVDTYSGAIYISPVGPTPFEYLSKVERTPDEKVDIAVSEVELPEIVTEATEITLPAEGKTYAEVKFAWASESEYAVVKDGKLVITLPKETTVVTVTLTATLDGAETVTETYTIKLVAPATNPFVAEQTPNPATGTAYKFFVYNAFHGKNFFFNGAINDKYLQSSDNIAEAVDVYLEEVKENDKVVGYRFYFDNNGTKTYIDITAEGKAALVTENPTAVYNYVAETNCWAAKVGTKECYIGSYVYNNSSYTTFSASETKYIKADNTGVTQFPANFAELTVKKVVAEQVKTPVAVTPYKFFVFNVHHNDFFYFNGVIKGDFLQTTNNIYDAVDVYLEEVKENDKVVGYRFYFMNGETKTYIDINANGKAALVTENPNAVYNYVAETNCWAAKVGTLECYLGSYLNKGKSYTTIGASETRYITADNTGVTQFPANFGIMAVASDKVVTDEEKVETEKKAITLAGEVLKATEVEVPVAGETYTDVVITWTVDGVAVENGKIAFVIGKASKTVKVVATITSGEVTDTKEFEVFVAGDPDAVNAPITSDIETSTVGSGAGSYVAERVTENGWSVTNAQLVTGKEWAGTDTYGWVINGKVGANGVITSAKFNGTVETVKFSYGFPFSDTKVKLTVAIVDAEGNVLVSNVLERTDLVKDKAYEYVWNLTEAEQALVTGDCRLVITNECLSNNSSSNKDRLMVYDIYVGEADHTHTDANTDGVCDGCQQEVDATGDTPLTGTDAN